MSPPLHDPRRRDFLKTGLAAAGTTFLAGTATSAQGATAAPSKSTAGIPQRPFGRTGHTLPVLGMGGSAMVRMFINAYGVELLDLDARVEMVRHAYDSGIRYFDTARVYGESEQIMGRGLKGVRDDCYVATKCHMTDPAKVRECVETSLEQLGMDHVDCVQIHSPAIERIGFDKSMEVHAELVKLKDEGMLRFIGLTTHIAFETVLQMINTEAFDQVLLAYGYFRKGMDTMLSNKKIEYRDMCLARAHDLGMAVVAMKVLGANIFSHNSPNIVAEFDAERRAQVPHAAVRWTLQDERVSMLNIGASMPADIDKNVAMIKGDTTFTNDDAELLADFSAECYESAAVKSMQVT